MIQVESDSLIVEHDSSHLIECGNPTADHLKISLTHRPGTQEAKPPAPKAKAKADPKQGIMSFARPATK